MFELQHWLVELMVLRGRRLLVKVMELHQAWPATS